MLYDLTDKLDDRGVEYRLVYSPTMPLYDYANANTEDAELIRSVEGNAEKWIQTIEEDPRYAGKFINLKNKLDDAYFVDYYHCSNPKGFLALSKEIEKILLKELPDK
jgi:hypothetical protein